MHRPSVPISRFIRLFVSAVLQYAFLSGVSRMSTVAVVVVLVAITVSQESTVAVVVVYNTEPDAVVVVVVIQHTATTAP